VNRSHSGDSDLWAAAASLDVAQVRRRFRPPGLCQNRPTIQPLRVNIGLSKMMELEQSYKASAQQFLRKLGVYERMKSSWVYDIYWRVANPRVLAERAGEVEFYRRVLTGFQTGDLVFDIGANQGYKTDIFLRLGARVVAVDPDEFNQRTLTDKFLKWRLFRRSVHIEGKAVSDRNATATMWLDAPGSAKNTLDQKWVENLREDDKRFGHRLSFGSTKSVTTITVDDLIDHYGLPFFIKIDVEGHELAVLRGMKCPVKYLSFEVNLPEFTSEGLQCIDRLHDISETGTFNYATECQDNLALKTWMSHRDFAKIFDKLTESCVEVFWRN